MKHPPSVSRDEVDWEEPWSPLRAFAAVWGLGLILIVLAYSLVSTLEQQGASDPAAATFARTHPGTPIATFIVPTSGQAAGAPRPDLLVFMLCDDETVAGAIYDGPISHLSLTLKPAGDRDVIADLLAGRPTAIPADSWFFKSRCFDQLIVSGAFS